MSCLCHSTETDLRKTSAVDADSVTVSVTDYVRDDIGDNEFVVEDQEYVIDVKKLPTLADHGPRVRIDRTRTTATRRRSPADRDRGDNAVKFTFRTVTVRHAGFVRTETTTKLQIRYRRRLRRYVHLINLHNSPVNYSTDYNTQ